MGTMVTEALVVTVRHLWGDGDCEALSRICGDCEAL